MLRLKERINYTGKPIKRTVRVDITFSKEDKGNRTEFTSFEWQAIRERRQKKKVIRQSHSMSSDTFEGVAKP